jgi:Mrp family chromosome partitioning ATPase
MIEAGSVGGDPAMLLVDGQLPKLMDAVQDYGFVVFDGPAGGDLHLAGILAAQADGALCCARWGRTLQCDVQAAIEDLHQQRIDVLGIVVTVASADELSLYERPRLVSPRFAEAY